jgi:hypothetical protein
VVLEGIYIFDANFRGNEEFLANPNAQNDFRPLRFDPLPQGTPLGYDGRDDVVSDF